MPIQSLDELETEQSIPLGSPRIMDELIQLVRKYQLAESLAAKDRLVEKIFKIIEPDLRSSIFGSIELPEAKDVLQEVLAAISRGLKKFKGESRAQFWAWCYSILRNKRNDYFRKQANERLISLPPEELLEFLDLSGDSESIQVGDRLDLEYALKLLDKSKPECRDYLQKRYVFGYTIGEVARAQKVKYDAARMKVKRCMDEVRSLIS